MGRIGDRFSKIPSTALGKGSDEQLCQVWALSSFQFLRLFLEKERRTWFEKRPVCCSTLYRKPMQLRNFDGLFNFTNFTTEFFTQFSPVDPFEIELHEETNKNNLRQKSNFGLTVMPQRFPKHDVQLLGKHVEIDDHVLRSSLKISKQ